MKKRTPRKLKKKNAKRGILIYDVASLPNSWTMRELKKSFEEYGIVAWASNADNNMSGKDCANPPMVVNNLRGVKIVDLSENYSNLNKKWKKKNITRQAKMSFL